MNEPKAQGLRCGCYLQNMTTQYTRDNSFKTNPAEVFAALKSLMQPGTRSSAFQYQMRSGNQSSTAASLKLNAFDHSEN